MKSEQIAGLVLAAIAVVGVVLLATLAEGAYVTELLLFLGGLFLPSPLTFGGGGGGGGGGRTARRVAGVAAALVVLMCIGCEGPPSVARRSVEIATVVVMDADRLAAERYAAAAAAALEASTTDAEYRARIAPHDALEAALRVAQSTVLAADAALDAWREGGAERWPAMAACIVAALGDVQRALAAVGLRAPPELESALTMAAGFALAACPGAGAPGEV